MSTPVSPTPAMLRELDEGGLRNVASPWPKTPDELMAVIGALIDRQHDYGTCCYAMSIAAVAAFNYVASKLGTTGFQSSCADLDVLRRTRLIDGPFAILNSEKLLYPQYDVPSEIAKWVAGWGDWLGEQARNKIAERGDGAVHPDVLAHWKSLAALHPAKVSP